MDTKKVQNISDQTITLVGIGVVEAGAIVEVPANFHHGDFAPAKKDDEKPKAISTKNK